MGMGKWLCDGMDVFDLTEEVYDYINNSEDKKKYLDQIDFVITYFAGDGGWDVKRDILPETFRVWGIEADYHSSDNIDSFKENYDKYDNY
jgi:hypothetical protein